MVAPGSSQSDQTLPWEEFLGLGTANPISLDELFSEPRILDMLDPGDAAALEAEKFSPLGLRMLGTDSLEMEKALYSLTGHGDRYEFPATPLSGADSHTITKYSPARPIYYPFTAAKTGQVLAVCPLNGKPVSSTHSFLNDNHHLSYRFQGEEVFFLLAGRWHGRRCAAAFPLRNLIILLDAPEKDSNIRQWVANSCQTLAQSIAKNPALFATRESPRRDGFVLVSNLRANLGHYFWQEMSGVSLLKEAGLLGRVRAILTRSERWFTPADMFPELNDVPVVKIDHFSEAQSALQEAQLLGLPLVAPIGQAISPFLKSRVLHVAESRISEGSNSAINAFCSSNRAIWINLRSHNKAWSNQVQGYADLLNHLHTLHSDIGVVFDGFEDTAGIADDIKALLNADIATVSAIGCSFEESIVWANKVASFVAVVGSGLVINSWLSDCSGVAHGNAAHLKQQQFWNCVAPGKGEVHFLSSGQVSGSGDLYGTYDFDWKILADHLNSILSSNG